MSHDTDAGKVFQNRGLFSDNYLRTCLADKKNCEGNSSRMFTEIRELLNRAQQRGCDKSEDLVRNGFLDPIFIKLGFKTKANQPASSDPTVPDYLLQDHAGNVITAAFVYPWGRWLDGPDCHDPETPDSNPGACVVSALDEGTVNWIIVTNGRQWRLYSKQAHARSTNFYEVDLEALLAAGDTDPNEMFRYWWLFFRAEAYKSVDDESWLDAVFKRSHEYAGRLGDRLKDRVFLTIVPQLAQGFLQDRHERLNFKSRPTDDDLDEIFEATLTLLYRLLFLLYAESRNLVPINEAPWQAASLKRIREAVASKAGNTEREVNPLLTKEFSSSATGIYDRLGILFRALDKGDTALNVPPYQGGLFNTATKESGRRQMRIAEYLLKHKIPDQYLATAIDGLSRDHDEKSSELAFIDYKSLEVRYLGSIYEGLLEFKLMVADEDLGIKSKQGSEKLVSVSAAKKGARHAAVVVKKNSVYLSNNKAERRSSGSYYTPHAIVRYIVENTVGPVLDRNFEQLKIRFENVRKTDEQEKLVDNLFSIRVCDPAMGTGVFLVEVVDFVTDRLLRFLNQFPINPLRDTLERTRSRIIESWGNQGISIDPANLTDIHLLKRFVLKRSIYGVDINPMAVELAKISLWLDCFTLGAPLSFLDHHLRCGNALLGTTFDKLETSINAAGKGKKDLWKWDDEPLRQGLKHGRRVSKLADATADEVARSATEYDAARGFLSGYKVVLDLLVAKHFGYSNAIRIFEPGQGIDLSSKESLVSSLPDEARETVSKIEALASGTGCRFFHWELEFPEIFFGFADDNPRYFKHKDRIQFQSAGFDCIVGNPPYSGHRGDENLKVLKELFEVCKRYQNLATAFIEQANRITRRHAQLGMIVPKSIQYVASWLPARKLIVEASRLNFLIDVSEAFDDVLLEQTICGWAKEAATNQYVAGSMGQTLKLDAAKLTTRFFEDLGCLPAEINAQSIDLFNKIESLGPRLGQFSSTSQALGYQAKINKSSAGKSQKIYRGKQVQPMELCDSDDVISESFLRSATTGEFTPKIRNMLQPKVVSQNIVAHVTKPKPRVWIISAPDPDGVLCLNTISTTILQSPEFSIYYISALLNSSLASWFMSEFVFCRAVRTMHLDHHYVGQLPVARCSKSGQQRCFDIYRKVKKYRIPKKERVQLVDQVIFDIYQFTEAEREFVRRYCYGN